MFQYAKALFFRGSFRMNPPILWGPAVIDVSKWAIGLTLIYMGILAGLSSFPPFKNINFSVTPYDPGIPYNELLLYDRTYRYSSFVNPLITALTAMFLYWLCIQLGLSKKRAVAAALIFGIASPAAVYAKLDFAQPLASLFVVLALIFFVRARSHGRINLVVTGTFLGLTILARTEMALVPVLVFVVATYFINPQPQGEPLSLVDRIKNLLWIAMPVIGFFVLNQYINYMRFGSWFGLGYQPGSEFNFNGIAVFTALLGNILSPERGLLLFFPLFFLSFFGLAVLIKQDRLIGIILLCTILGSILMYSFWEDWDAGYS